MTLLAILLEKLNILARKAYWYLLGLLYENGEPSLTRFIIFTSYFMFAVVSLYMLYYSIEWAHYNTFATLTGGGGTAAQIINKGYNTFGNSQIGSPTLSKYGMLRNPMNQNKQDDGV